MISLGNVLRVFSFCVLLLETGLSAILGITVGVCLVMAIPAICIVKRAEAKRKADPVKHYCALCTCA